MRATWSFTADVVQYEPFSARALGYSTGRSDAVGSLGSTRWSWRISCLSGVWSSAKPLRGVTRTQFMRDSTHSGERKRVCCNAWGSRRWTFGSRTSIGLSRDGVQRSRCRSSATESRRLVHCLLLAPRTQDSTRTPCSLGSAILGAQAASRKSSGTALYEARTLLGAGAGSSRPCRSTRKAGLIGGGSGWVELQRRGSIPSCNVFYAPVTNALELSPRRTRRECGKTGWPFSGSTGAGSNLHVTTAGTCDGRSITRREQHRKIRMPARYEVPDLRSTRVRSAGHWTRSGRKFAPARTVLPRRSAKRPLVVRRRFSCRRLAQGSGRSEDGAHWMANVPRQERESLRQPPRRQLAKAGSCRGETCLSSRTAGTRRQGCKGQRRRGKLRQRRDFRDVGPARPRDRARRFLPFQSGRPMFFPLIHSFSRETEFTKFVSEENATARSRHASRRRRIPMPRHRARCNRHEARAVTAALISCCLVRLSNGGFGAS